jgi:ribosomal protein S18 acetylase RimI-like enzyme
MMIRAAKIEDCREIAQVSVSSWKTTYRGQVPDSYLDDLSVPRREEGWRDWFTHEGKEFLVADENGRIVGFVNFGHSLDEDATPGKTGEVYAIYLYAESQGKQVGKSLWNGAMQRLRERGFSAATVWVLDTNRLAREFYERRGGSLDEAQKVLNIDGQDLLEVRYRVAL